MNARFLKSIETFNKKKCNYDSLDQIRVSLVHPYSLIGIEEVTEQSRTYLNTMRCVSQIGKTFAISKTNFEKILKEKGQLI